MRNNRNTGSSLFIRWILIALAIGLVVGVAIFSIFYFGFFQSSIFQPGRSSTSTATPTNSAITVTNPTGRGGACFDSPYGFTTVHADSQLVTFYKQLNVCWVRYQIHWDKSGKKPGIESAPNVYDWSQVDGTIATMNAAGIHVDFAIQDAPPWDKTQVCAADGQHFLPGPNEMAHFATLLATRYNGKNGHGYIDAFEIGNEEFDNHFVPGLGNNQSCRSGSYYGEVLKAGYQAIKAVDPKALVGMFGMWWHYLPHIQDFMTYLYSHGYGPYMDYMNFHYYHSGQDPAQTIGNDPSFDLQWQTMHNIAAQYGFGSKPIWVTETGWATNGSANAGAGGSLISPQTQASYMQYILNESEKSKVVTKVFWFTINSPNEAHNIYTSSGSPLPAVQVLQAMVRQKAIWN